MKHTKLPWNNDNVNVIKRIYNDTQDRRCTQFIAQLITTSGHEDETQCNGEFITRACNNHEKLVKALRDMLYIFDRDLGEGTIGREICDDAIKIYEEAF
jgi:hypothetical protein